jgi:hypothetical protein
VLFYWHLEGADGTGLGTAYNTVLPASGRNTREAARFNPNEVASHALIAQPTCSCVAKNGLMGNMMMMMMLLCYSYSTMHINCTAGRHTCMHVL